MTPSDEPENPTGVLAFYPARNYEMVDFGNLGGAQPMSWHRIVYPTYRASFYNNFVSLALIARRRVRRTGCRVAESSLDNLNPTPTGVRLCERAIYWRVDDHADKRVAIPLPWHA